MNRIFDFVLYWNLIQAQSFANTRGTSFMASSLPTTTAATTTTTTTTTCYFQDSQYSPCPSYSKYRFPSHFIQTTFSNPYELSLYINSTLFNVNDLKQLQQNFSCNNLTYDNFNAIRYRRTRLCVDILNSSAGLGCNTNLPPPTPVCQSDCIRSYKYFLDSTNKNTMQKLGCSYDSLELKVAQLELSCETYPLNGTNTGTTQCISGNDNEPNTCGFLDINTSCDYCQSESGSKDGCCTSSLTNQCTLLKTQRTKPQVSAVTDDNANKYMSYFIAGVTCLSLSILLILALIIYTVVIKKFTEQSQRTSFIDQAKPMLEGSSTQFTRLDHRTNSTNSASPNESSASVFVNTPTAAHNVVASTNPGTNLTTQTTWGATLLDPVDEDGKDLYRVAYPYQSVLEDELTLKINQVVILIQAFDDGWGLGRNVLTGVQGAFPMACVTKLTDEDDSNPSTIVVGEDAAATMNVQNVNFKTIQRRTSSQKIHLKYSNSTRNRTNIGFA